VLVPALLLLYPNRPPETVTAISLLVASANALSGSTAYARQGRIDYRSGLWFAAATLPGAIAGVFAVSLLPRRAFDALFALVLGGIALLLLRQQLATIRDPLEGRGLVFREILDRFGNRYVYQFPLWKGLGLSGGVGFFSSLLGIGGGILHVPLMSIVLHFPLHVAVATSQFVLMFMTAEASIVHALRGNLSESQVLVEAGLLAAGAVSGAQLGAWLGQRSPQSAVRRALVFSLVVISLRLGMQAAGF
jgi:uncharacterized protein